MANLLGKRKPGELIAANSLGRATQSDFQRVADEIGKLVAQKNQAYGSAFEKCGAFFKLLYPDGIKPEQYSDALLLARIFDKLMRIATAKDALGESPYRDVAGYGILGAVATEKK